MRSSEPRASLRTFWRAFPRDDDARAGEPFSASYVPSATGRGRFDLPVDHSGVLYVAETPEHAIAELLQPWRNRRLRPEHLRRAGRPLALVPLEIRGSEGGDLLDLCDPHALVEIDTGPDQVASRGRAATQRIARRAWDDGRTGVRWWSVFGGDWHGVALFEDRLRGWIEYGPAEVLTRDSLPLRAAASALGMDM